MITKYKKITNDPEDANTLDSKRIIVLVLVLYSFFISLYSIFANFELSLFNFDSQFIFVIKKIFLVLLSILFCFVLLPYIMMKLKITDSYTNYYEFIGLDFQKVTKKNFLLPFLIIFIQILSLLIMTYLFISIFNSLEVTSNQNNIDSLRPVEKGFFDNPLIFFTIYILLSFPIMGLNLFFILNSSIIEETIFRGNVLSSFKTHYSKNKAILISSLIFAIFHLFNVISDYETMSTFISLFIYRFFIGVLQAYLFIHSQNIITPIIIHFLINVISPSFRYFNVFLNPSLYNHYLNYVFFPLSIIFILLLMYIYSRLKKNERVHSTDFV